MAHDTVWHYTPAMATWILGHAEFHFSEFLEVATGRTQAGVMEMFLIRV